MKKTLLVVVSLLALPTAQAQTCSELEAKNAAKKWIHEMLWPRDPGIVVRVTSAELVGGEYGVFEVPVAVFIPKKREVLMGKVFVGAQRPCTGQGSHLVPAEE